MATSSSSVEVKLPGRLGNPSNLLNTDPRIDPRFVKSFEGFGIAGKQPDAPVTVNSSVVDIIDYLGLFEQGAAALGAAIAEPPLTTVTVSTETIKGVDGNDITLFVHTPKKSRTKLSPCIVHLHGGGMGVYGACDPLYHNWRDQLASAGDGMVVIGVEFRNSAGVRGPHPFPAGLNDCMSAVAWAHENLGKLGASHLLISGESGGGNLTLATLLKSKQNGTLSCIAGAFAMCPFIAGPKVWSNPGDFPALVSLVENEEIFLTTASCAVMAKAYAPIDATDPCVWPYFASVDDLRGLPPVIISVNECDPLRDEGLDFNRKLREADVGGTVHTVHGTPHAGDLMRTIVPDIAAATVHKISVFAESLGEPVADVQRKRSCCPWL